MSSSIELGKTVSDFRIQNHGSIYILEPLTKECIAWVEENVGDENNQRWFRGIVVEPRFIHDIYNGLIENGFQS